MRAALLPEQVSNAAEAVPRGVRLKPPRGCHRQSYQSAQLVHISLELRVEVVQEKASSRVHGRGDPRPPRIRAPTEVFDGSVNYL